MNAKFTDLPCGLSCLEQCEIRNKMLNLQKSLITLPADGAAQLVSTFITSYLELCKSSLEVKELYPPNIALPALFDFVLSAKYAKRMVSDGGWIYCAGNELDEEPS